MDFNKWISKINNIDNNFLINKNKLLNLINSINFKYLFLKKLDIKINNLFLFDYTIIWDCEFKNNYQKYISEIGFILLLNINKQIFFAGFFHIGFFNKLITNLYNYQPFYSEYMSVSSKTLKKIQEIEQFIYPHLQFINIWNNKNINLEQQLINFTKSIKHYKSIYINFVDELYNNIDNINVPKLTKILKDIIYSNKIKNLKNKHLFYDIYNLYINDSFIKKILVNIDDHSKIINLINLTLADKNCLNIVKGNEDINAIINNNKLFNKKLYNILNIIDIADYNTLIYIHCNSAKLYESYLCLIKFSDNYIDIIEPIFKKYLQDNFSPHNPLVDAFYTLQVFIIYNSFFIKKLL